MCNVSDWLPALVPLSGEWDSYLTVLYSYFTADFITSRPALNGVPVGLRRGDSIKGKHPTFWHILSDGHIEEDRLPDFRRCERIRWPRPIIENCIAQKLKIWKNKRNGKTRICIWCEHNQFLVVLDERKGYHLLQTAYPTDRRHTQKKLEREFKDYMASAAS